LNFRFSSEIKSQDARGVAIRDHLETAKTDGYDPPESIPGSVLKRDSSTSAENTIAFLDQSAFGTSSILHLKTLVVGAAGVGKTSLVNSLLAKGRKAIPTKMAMNARRSVWMCPS